MKSEGNVTLTAPKRQTGGLAERFHWHQNKHADQPCDIFCQQLLGRVTICKTMDVLALLEGVMATDVY